MQTYDQWLSILLRLTEKWPQIEITTDRWDGKVIVLFRLGQGEIMPFTASETMMAKKKQGCSCWKKKQRDPENHQCCRERGGRSQVADCRAADREQQANQQTSDRKNRGSKRWVAVIIDKIPEHRRRVTPYEIEDE